MGMEGAQQAIEIGVLAVSVTDIGNTTDHFGVANTGASARADSV